MHTQRKRLSAATVLFLVAAMVFAGLMVSAPRAAATHDTVMWSRPFLAAATDNEEYFSSALADGSGTFYIFYLRTDSGTGLTDVYESKWATRGTSGMPEPLLTDVLVTVNNVGEVSAYDPLFGLAQAPAAAIDHAGNLYVAWTSTSYDVYVSKSVDGGETWEPAVIANSATATAWDFSPSMAITGTGASERVWVAWAQFWVSGPTFIMNATVSYSVNQGATFIGYTNASGQGGASTLILSTDLAADSLGRLYLTYTAIEWPAFRLFANYTWSDTGSSWAPPKALNTSAGGFLPVVTVDAKDRVHIVWFDGAVGSGVSPFVYYTRSEDRGGSWTVPLPITQGQTGISGPTMPDIVVHEDEIMVAWTGQTFATGVAYVISADGGDLWYPEAFYASGSSFTNIRITADENGTYYATFTRYNGFDDDVGFVFWDGPASAPAITNIARGTGALTVTWSPSPEADVLVYRVWRSADGFSYDLVATVDAGTTSYADTGLANGTYWYRVTAIDMRGTSSHASAPMSATVGPTLQERMDQLESEIASLQAALAAAQTDINDLQTRLTTLQSAVNTLQQTVDTNDAAMTTQLNNLKTQLDNLQNQLNTVRTEQATQSMSYVNLGFEVIVVVLLALILIMQMRKPRIPASNPGSPPQKIEEEL